MQQCLEKVWTAQEIRERILVDNHWLERGIQAIYRFQSLDEQSDGQTRYQNGVGFNGVDSQILSSFAQWIDKGRRLTPKQVEIARRKMAKYAGQLARIANRNQ